VLQAIERNPGTNFHATVGRGDGVVKDGIVSETAHAEAIEPLHQAGLSLALRFILDADLAGKHDATSLAENLNHGQPTNFGSLKSNYGLALDGVVPA
jgi:hypothetical protein